MCQSGDITFRIILINPLRRRKNWQELDMTESRTQKERRDFLTERAIRFFEGYREELESISQLLKIRLDQLASAYTVENKLPRKAVVVQSRVKSMASFLRKLEKTGWTMAIDSPKQISARSQQSVCGPRRLRRSLNIEKL
jgi:hypothetical protein